MASYTGAAGVGAVEGAGSDAASAAAIDGADMLACDGGRLVCGLDCLEIFELSSSSRVVGRSTMLLALDSDDRFNSFSCLLRYDMNEGLLSLPLAALRQGLFVNTKHMF